MPCFFFAGCWCGYPCCRFQCGQCGVGRYQVTNNSVRITPDFVKSETVFNKSGENPIQFYEKAYPFFLNAIAFCRKATESFLVPTETWTDLSESGTNLSESLLILSNPEVIPIKSWENPIQFYEKGYPFSAVEITFQFKVTETRWNYM